jgi:hypothetical protein
MSFSWKKLQNGSDIRGVAMPGIEGEEVNLSTNTAEILGKSFGQWMMKNTSIKNEKTNHRYWNGLQIKRPGN